MNEKEKKITELFQQVSLLDEIIAGNQLFQATSFDSAPKLEGDHQSNPALISSIQAFLKGLGESAAPETLAAQVSEMKNQILSQPSADEHAGEIQRLGAEVFYLKARFFFWTGIYYGLLSLAFFFFEGLFLGAKFVPKVILLTLPGVLATITGFAMRIYVTGFAPVTNMYGTMIWVSMGVVLFGLILFALYKNLRIFALILAGSSAVLLLTESIPLVLSPDMDPIVAVLRNNFWLTIHVLTITISYAAFTIAMLVGNAALIQSLIGKTNPEKISVMARHVYRVIQLGVFLLTVGIILGGIWADYSWGRFWGWDPKETWALIADLGFIAILHARYIGWVREFGLLAMAPLAYLLVVMAWYGVNFILAAGLHSYGFSSGGATMVAVFVSLQVILSALAGWKNWNQKLAKGA